MRARRDFQPSLDLMPMRLAPSALGVLVSPMNPLSGAGSNSPTVIISPMNPLSGSQSGPSVADPTMIGPGSYTPPVTTTMPC
jgi:hypothetical protein